VSHSHANDRSDGWHVTLDAPKLGGPDDTRPDRPYRHMPPLAKGISLVVFFLILFATGYVYYLGMYSSFFDVLVIPLGLLLDFAFVYWLYRRYDDLHDL